MTALAKTTANGQQAAAIERVLIEGDLSGLTQEQRVAYHSRVCESLGLNPLTKPFEYLKLNGKTILYARRDATEQLRKRDRISINIVAREVVEGVYVVTARATTPDGRTDESIGAVPIEGLKGENRANAVMKAETKAKRRVTLSICGLGLLDESEVGGVPGAQVVTADGEVLPANVSRIQPAKVEPADLDAADKLALSLGERMAGVLDIDDAETAWDEFAKLAAEAAKAKRDALITETGRRRLGELYLEVKASLEKKHQVAP